MNKPSLEGCDLKQNAPATLKARQCRRIKPLDGPSSHGTRPSIAVGRRYLEPAKRILYRHNRTFPTFSRATTGHPMIGIGRSRLGHRDLTPSDSFRFLGLDKSCVLSSETLSHPTQSHTICSFDSEDWITEVLDAAGGDVMKF